MFHPTDMGLIHMGRKLETEQKFAIFSTRWKLSFLDPPWPHCRKNSIADEQTGISKTHAYAAEKVFAVFPSFYFLYTSSIRRSLGTWILKICPNPTIVKIYTYDFHILNHLCLCACMYSLDPQCPAQDLSLQSTRLALFALRRTFLQLCFLQYSSQYLQDFLSCTKSVERGWYFFRVGWKCKYYFELVPITCDQFWGAFIGN